MGSVVEDGWDCGCLNVDRQRWAESCSEIVYASNSQDGSSFARQQEPVKKILFKKELFDSQ